MNILLGALRYLAIAQLKDADRIARPFSIFGADWLVSKTGDRTLELDRYNPYSRVLKQLEARQQISPESAKIFLSVMREGKIPQWALSLIKPHIETIKLSAEEH